MLVPCQASELVFWNLRRKVILPCLPFRETKGENVVVRFGHLYGNATHPSNGILGFPRNYDPRTPDHVSDLGRYLTLPARRISTRVFLSSGTRKMLV